MEQIKREFSLELNKCYDSFGKTQENYKYWTRFSWTEQWMFGSIKAWRLFGVCRGSAVLIFFGHFELRCISLLFLCLGWNGVIKYIRGRYTLQMRKLLHERTRKCLQFSVWILIWTVWVVWNYMSCFLLWYFRYVLKSYGSTQSVVWCKLRRNPYWFMNMNVLISIIVNCRNLFNSM